MSEKKYIKFGNLGDRNEEGFVNSYDMGSVRITDEGQSQTSPVSLANLFYSSSSTVSESLRNGGCVYPMQENRSKVRQTSHASV
jgi:hypothetical protein